MNFNYTLGQIDLRDIYRIFHPTAEYTFFSSIYKTFFKLNHVIGHKTSLNKFKKTETMSSIFLNHNGMKLEINQLQEANSKIYKYVEIKQHDQLLVNQWAKEEIKG